jgi:hypothetical protein
MGTRTPSRPPGRKMAEMKRPLLLAVVTTLGLLSHRVDGSDLTERAARSCAVEASASVGEVAVGRSGVVRIAIRPDAGIHVQPRGPLKVTLSASPGLALSRALLGWADALGPRVEPPRFEVPFTATAPGPQVVSGRLVFFLCSDTWCVKQERETSVSVTVVAEHDPPPRSP